MNGFWLLDPLVLKVLFVSHSECNGRLMCKLKESCMVVELNIFLFLFQTGKLIEFLNVYAPNSATGKIRLWNMLLQDLLSGTTLVYVW